MKLVSTAKICCHFWRHEHGKGVVIEKAFIFFFSLFFFVCCLLVNGSVTIDVWHWRDPESKINKKKKKNSNITHDAEGQTERLRIRCEIGKRVGNLVLVGTMATVSPQRPQKQVNFDKKKNVGRQVRHLHWCPCVYTTIIAFSKPFSFTFLEKLEKLIIIYLIH